MSTDKPLTYASANRGARLLTEKGVGARAINYGKGHAILLKDGSMLVNARHFNEAYEGAIRLKPTKEQREDAAIFARL